MGLKPFQQFGGGANVVNITIPIATFERWLTVLSDFGTAYTKADNIDSGSLLRAVRNVDIAIGEMATRKGEAEAQYEISHFEGGDQ